VSIYTTNQDGPGKLAVPVDRPVYRDGVEIRYFPIQTLRFWGTSLPLALALAQKIPASDLVHIHSLYLFHDLVAGHYCRRYQIPYLMRPHGPGPFIHRRHRWRNLMERLLVTGIYGRPPRSILPRKGPPAAPFAFKLRA
jgi:hypothetical protein